MVIFGGREDVVRHGSFHQNLIGIGLFRQLMNGIMPTVKGLQQ
jgi:hypothetical protein